MNVAIVGTSIDLTDEEKKEIKQMISDILIDYIPLQTTIISGGAKGVDSLASEVGLSLGFAVKPLFPLGYGWEFNKKRNLQIAEECDELFCISVPVKTMECYHHDPSQDHQKTAGCFTLNKAKELGKKTQLIVI